MREIIYSVQVRSKMDELEHYLIHEYKMSRTAARARVDRIDNFLAGLSGPADYALCRFRHWRDLGYRCLPFEGWVFAYEVVPEGVIVRDMFHGAALKNT